MRATRRSSASHSTKASGWFSDRIAQRGRASTVSRRGFSVRDVDAMRSDAARSHHRRLLRSQRTRSQIRGRRCAACGKSGRCGHSEEIDGRRPRTDRCHRFHQRVDLADVKRREGVEAQHLKSIATRRFGRATGQNHNPRAPRIERGIDPGAHESLMRSPSRARRRWQVECKARIKHHKARWWRSVTDQKPRPTATATRPFPDDDDLEANDLRRAGLPRAVRSAGSW